MSWLSDVSANKIIQSYVNNFMDVSGNFKVRGESGTIATWTGSTLGSQLGQTLTGDAVNDRIFSVMGMSSDGLKIVGAAQLDPTTDSRGSIHAHYYNGSSWVDYGSLIEAVASEVGSTAYSSIADMSDDGTRIFAGWRQLGSDVPDTKGFGKVYDYVNNDWSQVGDNIVGDNTGDDATRVGKISGDGTTIAHMSGYNDPASIRYCKVRRYNSSTNTWDQIGSNIAVALTNKNTDKTDCLAISQNGNIVAIGSNEDGTSSQGAVRIYEYNSGTNSWSQLGSTILGEYAGDEFGISVDMNDNGTVVIVGAWKNDDTSANDGNARVFEYNGSSWVQVGSNIIPNTSDNDPSYFGITVRVSGNGEFFVVNGYQSKNPAGQQQSGETRVYRRDGDSFTQIIDTIYGSYQDFFGWQTFLNTDGTIFAVGSGGFNTVDLHPMKIYQLNHSYDYTNFNNTFLDVSGGTINMIQNTMDISSGVVDISGTTWLNEGTGGHTISTAYQKGLVIESDKTSANDAVLHVETTGQTQAFSVRANGDVYSDNTLRHSSDDRRKINEQHITNAMETLNKLSPQIYTKLNDLVENGGTYSKLESGLIAQEIYYNAPELRHLVTIQDENGNNLTPQEYDLSGNDIQNDPDYSALGWGPKSAYVDYTGLIPYLIKANQEKQATLDAQESTITQQTSQIEDLKTRVTSLQA